MLYVDDGAFTFISRKDIEAGSYLVYKKFNRFGLQMHIGTPSKESKTECVFFLPPGNFKPSALPQSTPPTDPSQLPVTSKPKQESEEQKRKRHDNLYDAAPETALINIREHGHVTFTKRFKYLGGYFS